MYYSVSDSTLFLILGMGIVIGFAIGFAVAVSRRDPTISLLSPEGTIRLPKPSQKQILEEWYRRNVAKYEGARMSSEDLYGRPGLHFTLRGFIIARDLPKDFINRAIMEKFLIDKKHPTNYKKGYLEFEGICCIIWGDVSTGNYGT